MLEKFELIKKISSFQMERISGSAVGDSEETRIFCYALVAQNAED